MLTDRRSFVFFFFSFFRWISHAYVCVCVCECHWQDFQNTCLLSIVSRLLDPAQRGTKQKNCRKKFAWNHSFSVSTFHFTSRVSPETNRQQRERTNNKIHKRNPISLCSGRVRSPGKILHSVQVTTANECIIKMKYLVWFTVGAYHSISTPCQRRCVFCSRAGPSHPHTAHSIGMISYANIMDQKHSSVKQTLRFQQAATCTERENVQTSDTDEKRRAFPSYLICRRLLFVSRILRPK